MGANAEPPFGLRNVIEDRGEKFRVSIPESGIELRSHIRFVIKVARRIPQSNFRFCHCAASRSGGDRR
jgi:hypothetical protein